MTIFKGRSKSQNMMQTLDTIFKSEGFTEISSNVNIDGRVYKTLGLNGTSEFYIRLLPSTVIDRNIDIGVYEKYVPGSGVGISGTFTNGRLENSLKWASSAATDVDVDYVINITKDRFIAYVEGEVADTRSKGSLVYAGLPTRYDPLDTNANFAGIAVRGGGITTTKVWYSIKNRPLVEQSAYDWSYYTPSRAMGWGNQLFLSPMIIGSPTEGPRGELNQLYLITTPNTDYEARHKDTFVRDGKTYIILGNFIDTTGGLPNTWYAMQI